jgi:hypothetical protein
LSTTSPIKERIASAASPPRPSGIRAFHPKNLLLEDQMTVFIVAQFAIHDRATYDRFKLALTRPLGPWADRSAKGDPGHLDG